MSNKSDSTDQEPVKIPKINSKEKQKVGFTNNWISKG